jgi:tight adherence protein B
VVTLVTSLVFFVTFLVVALAVLMGWLALQRGKLESSLTGTSDTSPGPALFKDESLSTINVWASLLEHFDFINLLKTRLEQAGVSWSVGRFTSLMLLCGSIGVALPLQFGWTPVWVAGLIGVLLASLPYFYIMRRRAKRFLKFEEGFPDALDSLARALRAGHTFGAGMDIAANESTPPVSGEQRKVATEGNLGMSWEIALQNLGRRIPLLEVNMFVSAVQLQSRTGGKLNEVLSSVAETMRESLALKGEVRALAAHGCLTGTVLTLLPLVIAAIMAIVNPGYLDVLLQSQTGRYLIVASIACLIAGHFVIRSLVDIKV